MVGQHAQVTLGGLGAACAITMSLRVLPALLQHHRQQIGLA